VEIVWRLCGDIENPLCFPLILKSHARFGRVSASFCCEERKKKQRQSYNWGTGDSHNSVVPTESFVSGARRAECWPYLHTLKNCPWGGAYLLNTCLLVSQRKPYASSAVAPPHQNIHLDCVRAPSGCVRARSRPSTHTIQQGVRHLVARAAHNSPPVTHTPTRQGRQAIYLKVLLRRELLRMQKDEQGTSHHKQGFAKDEGNPMNRRGRGNK
jgi:hypothetical protein